MTGCCPYLYVGGVPHLYQTTHLLSPFLFVKSLLFLLRPLCSALLCVAFTKSQEFLPCRGGRIAAVMKCHLLALPLDLPASTTLLPFPLVGCFDLYPPVF